MDDIAIVKSMVTDAFNHAPGQMLMNTGTHAVRPAEHGRVGAVRAGSETQDLPGFVVFSSGSKGPSGGDSCWGSGFLPTVYQGVQFRSGGDPVLYLSNPPGVDHGTAARFARCAQAAEPDAPGRRPAIRRSPRASTRSRWRSGCKPCAPELMDIGKEPKETLEMYGAEPGKASFANNCLLARRLVEKGVRFVQLYHEAWDQHSNLVKDLQKNCLNTDRAVRGADQGPEAARAAGRHAGDLGRRIRPHADGAGRRRRPRPSSERVHDVDGGRRHQGRVRFGETDELGFNVVKDRVHVHDLHATMLHLLGFDHTRLTYKFQGRPFRLTDVSGTVVESLLRS